MIHLPRMPRVQACVFQLFAGTFGDIQKNRIQAGDINFRRIFGKVIAGGTIISDWIENASIIELSSQYALITSDVPPTKKIFQFIKNLFLDFQICPGLETAG